MKNLLRTSLMTALVAGLMVFAATAANAGPVTFSTTASFNGGAFSSPNAIVFGGMGDQLSLTFTGVTNSMVNTDPAGFTFASLGEIQTATTGNGATITAGTTFAIRVTQTVPSGGSGDFSGTLAGTITQNSSTGILTFTVTHMDINGVSYDVQNIHWRWCLHPQTMVSRRSRQGFQPLFQSRPACSFWELVLPALPGLCVESSERATRAKRNCGKSYS